MHMRLRKLTTLTLTGISTRIATESSAKSLFHAVECSYRQSGFRSRSHGLDLDPGPRAGLMRALIDGDL